MKELLDRLERDQVLEKKEFVTLLENHQKADLAEYLAQKGAAQRDRIFGRNVFLRGLIEFTNYCKNDCFYCGLRKSNRRVDRYRLSPADILARCEAGHALGFRTFVLQGGEDEEYGHHNLVKVVREIVGRFPDCAVTLSVGEHSRAVYEDYYRAGASRFLLRHETADDGHYRKLHPPVLSLAERKRCLRDLKEFGFQVWAGF